MGIIACSTSDVLGYGCICEKNGWEHGWGEAPASVNRPGLHWCENCDCCVAHMDPVSS
jgi:hypothetical protein